MTEALWTELEKIDVLRERLGIGYEEARAVLFSAQGDVLKALDNYEKSEGGCGADCDMAERGKQILDGLGAKMRELGHTKINVKRHEETLLSVSAPLGLALAYTVWRKPGLRILALAGALGAALKHCELEVVPGEKSGKQERSYNFAADEEY